MYLTAHAAAGAAAAGLLTANPLVAFGLGWLSHYVVDFIPHGDEAAGEWVSRGNEVRRLTLLFSIDALVLAALVAAQVMARGFSWVTLAAAAGSTVPDVLWGLEKLFGRRLFGPLQQLHGRVHNALGLRLPTWLGLAFQACFAGWFWYRLIVF